MVTVYYIFTPTAGECSCVTIPETFTEGQHRLMKTSFYSPDELAELGLKSYGENVLISRKASIYSPENISVGHDVRIDDFCILSGKIEIGSYVHIAAYVALYAGKYGITVKDFSGLSARCVVYAMSDNFSGDALLGPTVPDECRRLNAGEVVLEKYVNIGTGSTILPRVHIGEGTSVGAMSLVGQSLPGWGVYFGIPCKKIMDRSRKMLELEEKYISKNTTPPPHSNELNIHALQLRTISHILSTVSRLRSAYIGRVITLLLTCRAAGVSITLNIP